MRTTRIIFVLVLSVLALVAPGQTATGASLIDNGPPDGRMAMASSPAAFPDEVEAADDFTLSSATTITSATFTGLLPNGAALSDVSDVQVEIYRVFPLDSDTGRTPCVPTRTNSPSDNVFDSRDSAGGSLSFSSTLLSSSFTTANSVINGIHCAPNQLTGGEGAVNGEEVQFTATFSTPFHLAANHYFFVPLVQLSSGQFLWLSAAGPSTAGDLQVWIRNGLVQPDWLRVGTDIVGGAPAPEFNASFSLSGSPTPTRVGRFTALRRGKTVIFRWRLAIASGVAGFNIFDRGRRVNPRIISFHRVRSYRYAARCGLGGRFALQIVLVNGQTIMVAAGKSG